LVISFKLLNKLILTSDSASFNNCKNTGKICSVVGFFPITEETAKNDPANDYLT